MEMQSAWEDPFAAYVGHFHSLMGDQRTRRTFAAILRGIIAGGSLVCQKIAAASPVLAAVENGAQRVIRLAKGQSTDRSTLSVGQLTERLRERGVAQLREVTTDDLWLILDLSELRKPQAQEMPALMEVRDLHGKLVPGYRTLEVLGVTPKRRGILYQRVFSSHEAGFESEPLEVQAALQTVSEALAPLKATKTVTWIMDSGLDDVAVWRTIWEQHEHLVCRVCHTDRLVEYLDRHGEWQAGDIAQAQQDLRLLATAQTHMKVCAGRQKLPKMQPVQVELRADPLRLAYETNVRRKGAGETVQQQLWLVEVRLPETRMEPWLLVTDWPVEDDTAALRIFRMYRQRWAVEDAFRFTKECLGWEEVRLLDLEGIRTLVAMAWIAAGFLYELGVTLEWPEVRLLARMGGWVPHKNRPPGKIVITRGLSRLIEWMTTEAFLNQYIAEHGGLPPRIAAFIGRKPSGERL